MNELDKLKHMIVWIEYLPVSCEISDNSIKFINTINNQNLMLPEISDIFATPYGNIVIEFHTQKGLVSIEIGKYSIGFFTDFNDGHNYGSESIETDFESIPEEISVHLKTK